MNHYNNTGIEGRLTKDPEFKQLQNGGSILRFSIANNRSFRAKGASERTEVVSYFNCVEFGKAAEVHAPYLKKGKHVLVSGVLEQRRWKDDAGNNRSDVQINVKELRMLDRPEQASSSHQEEPQSSGDAWSGMGEEVPDRDDDSIPF